MTERTDIHRPGAIIPEDYACVAVFSYPTGEEGVDPEGYMDEWSAWANEHPSVTPTKHRNGGCTICGAHFRHGAILHHVPTDEFIVIGHECARSHELALEDTKWQRAQKAAKKRRQVELKRERMRVKREAFLAAHPGLREALELDHYITTDLARKFQRYGDMSEKQVALAFKLVREAEERANRPPKPEELNVPVPEGRHVVRGVVIKEQERDDPYSGGTITKITVKVQTPRGVYLVWGTCPRAILDAESEELRRRHDADLAAIEAEGVRSYAPQLSLKGATVEFTATLTRLDEGHFGFFKRPTKPSVEFPPDDRAERVARLQRDKQAFLDQQKAQEQEQERRVRERQANQAAELAYRQALKDGKDENAAQSAAHAAALAIREGN